MNSSHILTKGLNGILCVFVAFLLLSTLLTFTSVSYCYVTIVSVLGVSLFVFIILKCFLCCVLCLKDEMCFEMVRFYRYTFYIHSGLSILNMFAVGSLTRRRPPSSQLSTYLVLFADIRILSIYKICNRKSKCVTNTINKADSNWEALVKSSRYNQFGDKYVFKQFILRHKIDEFYFPIGTCNKYFQVN